MLLNRVSIVGIKLSPLHSHTHTQTQTHSITHNLTHILKGSFDHQPFFKCRSDVNLFLFNVLEFCSKYLLWRKLFWTWDRRERNCFFSRMTFRKVKIEEEIFCKKSTWKRSTSSMMPRYSVYQRLWPNLDKRSEMIIFGSLLQLAIFFKAVWTVVKNVSS